MRTVTVLAVGQDNIVAPDPWNGQRYQFYIPTMQLWCPSALHLECLTGTIHKFGSSIMEAYTGCSHAGIGDINFMLPHPDLRPCISEILNTKYFDTEEWEWKPTAGQFIINGFAACIKAYKDGEWDTKAGRLKIAPGVYTPSATEEHCIRSDYRIGGNLREAYIQCGCQDIIPNWSTEGTEFVDALDAVETILRTNPNQHLYFSVKAAWFLCQLAPHHHVPHHHIPHHHVPHEAAGDNTWLYVAAAVGIGLILYKR